MLRALPPLSFALSLSLPPFFPFFPFPPLSFFLFLSYFLFLSFLSLSYTIFSTKTFVCVRERERTAVEMSRVLKAWFGSNGKALLIKQGDITKEVRRSCFLHLEKKAATEERNKRNGEKEKGFCEGHLFSITAYLYFIHFSFSILTLYFSFFNLLFLSFYLSFLIYFCFSLSFFLWVCLSLLSFPFLFEQASKAIVNAANENLSHGGGVGEKEEKEREREREQQTQKKTNAKKKKKKETKILNKKGERENNKNRQTVLK